MHALERDEKTGVLPADYFEGTTGVMSAIHQNDTTDGVGDSGGDPLLPRIHPGGADATGKIGLVGTE